ncbi:MAG: diacylglycerol kinase family protein [Nitrospirota bacterium]
MKLSIVIIGNPAARKSSTGKIELASSFLVNKGYNTEILRTEKSGHATILARQAAAEKPALIIAAGGDGTINEVMNGLIHSDIPLAILPLGTTNVLARELSVPEDIHGALEKAISGIPKRVSLGKIALTETSISRYFCLMAGIGFDGKAVYDVNPSLKRISGKTAYIFSGVRNFLNYSPNELFFNIDGKEYSGYCAIIGKAGKYGGNFRVTPDASLSEPDLYSCIFKGRKRADLLRYVFGIIKGTHLGNEDIIYLRSTNIEILGSAHIQIDGDYFGITPAKISVEKDVLRLIY